MMTLIMKLIKVLSLNQVPKKRLIQMDGDIGVRQWIIDTTIKIITLTIESGKEFTEDTIVIVSSTTNSSNYFMGQKINPRNLGEGLTIKIRNRPPIWSVSPYRMQT